MSGRLFKRLKERVKSRRREHVHLVDVVDLEAATAGGEFDGLTQFSDLFDAVVARTVDFEDVEVDALGDFAANVGVGIEFDRGTFRAIEGLGENARGRGFSRSAGTDEEVGVSEPILLDSVAQRADDMVLAENVGKGLGAVFSGENLIAHAGSLGRIRGSETDFLGFDRVVALS